MLNCLEETSKDANNLSSSCKRKLIVKHKGHYLRDRSIDKKRDLQIKNSEGVISFIAVILCLKLRQGKASKPALSLQVPKKPFPSSRRPQGNRLVFQKLMLFYVISLAVSCLVPCAFRICY